MRTLFFVPLCVIAVFEAQVDAGKNQWVKDWFSSPDDGGEDAPHFQDPEVNGADAERGLAICKVPFKDLVALFPDTTHVSGVLFCDSWVVSFGRWLILLDAVCGGGHDDGDENSAE